MANMRIQAALDELVIAEDGHADGKELFQCEDGRQTDGYSNDDQHGGRDQQVALMLMPITDTRYSCDGAPENRE